MRSEAVERAIEWPERRTHGWVVCPALRGSRSYQDCATCRFCEAYANGTWRFHTPRYRHREETLYASKVFCLYGEDEPPAPTPEDVCHRLSAWHRRFMINDHALRVDQDIHGVVDAARAAIGEKKT